MTNPGVWLVLAAVSALRIKACAWGIFGRLDTTSAPRLEAELRQNLNGVTCLDLDFAGLEYISSAGLRVLLSAQKVMNKQGEMVIHNVNETVMEVFEITGFTDILTTEPA